MRAVLDIIYIALWLFFVVLIIRVVLDYVQMFARDWVPRGPMLVVAEAVYTVTDTPLRALRRVIPPLRIGTVALDLSFLVLVIAIQVGLWLTAAAG